MMNTSQLAVIFLLIVSCTTQPAPQEEQTMDDHTFYVGTYTNVDSQGIYKYLLRADGSLEKIGLVAETNNPSFLAKNSEGSLLVAVNEIKDEGGAGGVESYLIEEDTLLRVDGKSSGGAYPCHINITPSGYVLTANYGDGTVALLKLASDGTLTGPLDVQQHTGQGATDRQQAPHAHSVWLEGDEQNLVSVDLGTNELWFSKINSNTDSIEFRNPRKLNLSPDLGPRHLTFHPQGKWTYVLNELSSTVAVLEKNSSGEYVKKSSISTLPTDYDGKNSCADIHISSDGKFLYASNRGHNSIVIYQVNPEDGTLQLVGHEPTRGEIPRNFALSPNGQYLLVANQQTNSLVSFQRDQQQGTLQFVQQIEAPTPVCILF